MATTRKHPENVPRRVWRMTAESPQGEYLELVPKDTQGEIAPKRVVYPGAEATPLRRSTDTLPTSSPAPARPDGERRMVPGAELSNAVKVLKPAQVESWQSSSFDLLTGCQVRDVSDTIPGQVFDELFGEDSVWPLPPSRRRR